MKIYLIITSMWHKMSRACLGLLLQIAVSYPQSFMCQFPWLQRKTNGEYSYDVPVSSIINARVVLKSSSFIVYLYHSDQLCRLNAYIVVPGVYDVTLILHGMMVLYHFLSLEFADCFTELVTCSTWNYVNKDKIHQIITYMLWNN